MRRLICIALLLTALAASVFPPSLFVSSSSLHVNAVPLPHVSHSAAAAFMLSAAHVQPAAGDATVPHGPHLLGVTRMGHQGSSKQGENNNSNHQDCFHSTVELSLHNHHPTQDIIVYSAHIEPSVLFPLQTVESVAPSHLRPQQAPPPLFPQDTATANNLQNHQRDYLHVHPGSTVTVPVSIMPHYRRYDQSATTTTLQSTQQQLLNQHPTDYPHDPIKEVMKSIADLKHSSLNKSDKDYHSTQVEAQQQQQQPNIHDVPTLLWKDMSLSSSLNYINERDFIQRDISHQITNTLQDVHHPSLSTIQEIVPQAQIHETLLANTSWGVLRIKLPSDINSHCQHSNEYRYGLPNNLIFMDGGGGWYARGENSNIHGRNYTADFNMDGIDKDANANSNSHDYFLYNLYLDNIHHYSDSKDHDANPAIQVWKVFTTKPEFVSVQVLHHSSFVPSASDSAPLHPFTGVTIPPGHSHVYIATIRLLPDQLNYTHISSITDLGFLQLQTNVGDFSIALDFIPNRHRWGAVYGVEGNYSTVANVELSKSYKLDKLRTYSILPPEYDHSAVTNSFRRSDTDQSMATSQFIDQMSKQNRASKLDWSKFGGHEPFLLTQPCTINFGVITTGSRSMRIPINLANTSPLHLNVMRVSVTMRMIVEEQSVPLEEDPHDLTVGIDFMGLPMVSLSDNGSVYEFPHDMLFSPGATYHYPVNIWCKFIVTRGQPVTPRTYIGSVLFYSAVSQNATFPQYGEWVQQSLLDDPLSQKLVTAVPFRVSIIPGNFRISTDSLLFPSHPTMLPPEEQSLVKRRNKKKVPDYFDRFLEVTNNFVVPITITSLEISNSREYGLCNSVFSIPPEDSSWGEDWKTAENNNTWRLPIRFSFSKHLTTFRFSKKCILTIETDKVGKQSLPLIIHSGELIAEVQNGEGGVQNNECLLPINGTLTKERGLACLYNWIETKTEGRVFHDAVKEMILNRTSSDSCRGSAGAKTPEEDYFSSLARNNPHDIEPVLIKLGALNSASHVERSLLLTNMNPAPVEVTVSSAMFEHMTVSIGHKSISIPDALEHMPSPNPNSDHTKYFLTHSTSARSFLSKMKYKVDISLSPRASLGELHSLYMGQAVDETFQDLMEFRVNQPFEKDEMTCSTGLLVSTDGSFYKNYTSRAIGMKKWTIPPGGVARFVVTVNTPHRNELTSDMSSFIATGLTLETNFGQAFPIILTYSVLLGQLHLVPSQSSHLANGTRDESPSHVQIPMTVQDASLVSLPRHGVPISIESSFSKDIFVGEIKSCSRWFGFTRIKKNVAKAPSSKDFLSNYIPVKAIDTSSPTVVPVGEVNSVLSCSNACSFFACALEWLQNRHVIQPTGCGLADEEIFRPLSKLEANEPEMSIKHMKIDAINLLREAVAFLTRPQVAGFVTRNDVEIIKQTLEAWGTISSHGLNLVTGHLTAFSAYHDGEISMYDNATSNTETENIFEEIVNNNGSLFSVPVASILLKSTLDVPQLFDGKREHSYGVVEFDSVHVAQTSEMYIPVSNPSGVSISVRLSAVATGRVLDGNRLTAKEAFMQTSVNDRNPWWTGESYWMAGKDGQLIEAPHNVTFMSGSGSSVNLVQPALHSISSFLLGCGTRCGRRSDADNAGEDVLFSTIGAGSGSHSALIGHPWHVTGTHPRPARKFGNVDPQPFAVGVSGVQEVVLPPYGHVKLGPVFFRPPQRGEFNTSIFISNNLTGLEEVKLRGRGTWEKLVFLGSEDDINGGDIEFRNGRSALVFSGSATSDNKPVVKSFVLANLGDVAVNISSVSMRSSEIRHFSHRSPPPMSSVGSNGFWDFLSQSKSGEGSSKCSNSRFHLVGCQDQAPPKVWLHRLFPWHSAIKSLFHMPFSPTESTNATNFTSFQNVFTLNPNENMTFFIEHQPDCVLRASYASVIFEISGRDIPTTTDQWQKSFRSDKLELLVGYSMNPYAYCLPHVPSQAKVLEKAFSFAIPSRLLNILSFGLYRRQELDDKGDQFIQYHVEVSYVAALFLLLLTLLVLDLYASVEFPNDNDLQGSSWKQTLRCLARADPVSADLVALGKEQTKHVLMRRFRKENVMPTTCVQPDGSFTRDKPGDASVSSAPTRRMSPSNQQAKTFSDAVFHRNNLLTNESKSKDPGQETNSSGLLTSGLAWRTAARRGVSISRSPTASMVEPQYLARTRSAMLKKKKPLQPRRYSNAASSSVSPPARALDVNGNHDKSAIIDQTPPPQDKQAVPTTDRTTTTDLKNVSEKEPPNDRSKPNNETCNVESQPNLAVTNKKIPTKKPTVTKEETVVTKPTVKPEQQTRNADKSKQKQAVTDTKPKNGRNNRADISNPTEQTANDIKPKATKKPQPAKRNTEQNLVRPPNNGGEVKNGVSQPSSSSHVVVKQPGKGRQGKEASKNSDTSTAGKEKKQDSRKKKQNNPQVKAAASTSKANPKATLPKRSTSEESIPYPTPVSSAQPSPYSEKSILTPKPLSSTQSTQSTQGTLRPPPGLLPPPGFTEPSLLNMNDPTSPPTTLFSPEPSFSELSPTKTPDVLTEIQSPDSLKLHMNHESMSSPSLACLLSPHFEDEYNNSSHNKEFVNSSMLITDLLPPPPSLTPPLFEQSQSDLTESMEESGVHDLLDSGNSFNVMSFLNGIMNDSATTSQPKEAVQSATTTSNSVPLDPWSPLMQESPRSNPLAAIIGRISDVEATTLRGQDEEHEIAGIPLTSSTNTPSLLTPSALQNNISGMEPTYTSLATEVLDEEQDDDEFLEPDSFYSQLLGGE